MAEEERWLPILGFSEYKVSNYGRIIRHTTGYELQYGSRSCNGYEMARLMNNDVIHSRHVHLIVAQHFLPNPDCRKSVRHKNGNKRDNRASNLEWKITKRVREPPEGHVQNREAETITVTKK